MEIVPFILSGVIGTRLLPLSRKQYPKQCLSIVDGKVMSADRLGVFLTRYKQENSI